MAARLFQLQRLALQYSSAGKVPQMDPLDLSAKLPFPWSLPGCHPPPPLWGHSWPKSRLKDKDIFRCVWCTESYPTLEELTGHLVEAKHGSGPPSSESSVAPKAPLPRKLVRGQDVWLGKGQEQTREILKCMWCGQSFKSLAELTTHMQETKHYTKVISQEQITSWKQQQNGAEGSSPPPNNSGSTLAPPPPSTPPKGPPFSPPGASSQGGNVSDVLTCKVCEEPCSSLKDLTAHMARSNHYHHQKPEPKAPLKRHRESPPPKEKRKKSLPVRKLLELERIKSEPLLGPNGSPAAAKAEGELSGSILGSLEAMVETSFKGSAPKKPGGLLSRLGIEEDKPVSSSVEEELFPRLYPKFLSSFLNSRPEEGKRGGEERLSSPSSSSSSPLPLRCSLCSDELGDKENFADHFERKHAGLMLSSPKEHPFSTTSATSNNNNAGEESSESKFLKYSELAKQLSGR